MGKRKGKKADIVDPVSQRQIQQLTDLKNFMEESVSSYFEKVMNDLCAKQCSAIDKEYGDVMKALPQDIRNMTMSQLTELIQKEDTVVTPPEKDARSLLLKKAKMTTEKKKTINRLDRKRSVSASTTKPLGLLRQDNPTSRIGRTISESSMMTPVNNRLRREPSFAVTPKFNVNLPPSKMARKARAGEIAMSVTGSPLQVTAESTVPSHKISLSLGNGRVLTFNDKGCIDKDLTDNIDDSSKETLKNVMETLGEIIKR